MNTENRINLILLSGRITLAVVVFAHGAQKLFGWFGGYGFEGTMGYLTQTAGLPYLIALAVILIESIGMIALALGLFSRIVAALLIAVMIGAIFVAHLPNGFFMNWSGGQAGEGYEYHLLVIALSFTHIILGSGAWSLDALLQNKRRVSAIA